jgi:hypothetical protein
MDLMTDTGSQAFRPIFGHEGLKVSCQLGLKILPALLLISAIVILESSDLVLGGQCMASLAHCGKRKLCVMSSPHRN